MSACAETIEPSTLKLFPEKDRARMLNEILQKLPAVSMLELEEALGEEIKGDMQIGKLTFFTYFSALLDRPMSLVLCGESSIGKTYIQTTCARLFADEEHKPVSERFVVCKSYDTPSRFYHETGTKDEERHVRVIKASPRVFSFLEAPDTKLLDRIKTLMSQDQYSQQFSYTDAQHNPQTALIEGFPAVVYSSTQIYFRKEHGNRTWLATPSSNIEKNEAACLLVLQFRKDPRKFMQNLEQDPVHIKIKTLTSALLRLARDNAVFTVEIHDIDKIFDEFKRQMGGKFLSRSSRDLGRLITLVQVIALFDRRLLTNDQDVEEAFKVVEPIIGPNLRGISPAVWGFHKNIIEPLALELKAEQEAKIQAAPQNIQGTLIGKPIVSDVTFAIRDIRKQYYEVTGERLEKARCDLYLEALLQHGLVEQTPDPQHQGWVRYRATVEDIGTLSSSGLSSTTTLPETTINQSSLTVEVQEEAILDKVDFDPPPSPTVGTPTELATCELCGAAYNLNGEFHLCKEGL